MPLDNLMPADQVVEPIHVNMRIAVALTGESRSEIYKAIGRGELDVVKNGQRTLLIYQQLKKRCLARPVVSKLRERPDLAAARDKYFARLKHTQKTKRRKR